MPFIDSGGWIALAIAAPKGPSLAKRTLFGLKTLGEKKISNVPISTRMTHQNRFLPARPARADVPTRSFSPDDRVIARAMGRHSASASANYQTKYFAHCAPLINTRLQPKRCSCAVQ